MSSCKATNANTPTEEPSGGGGIDDPDGIPF